MVWKPGLACLLVFHSLALISPLDVTAQTPRRLTLEEAIAEGLRNNLRVLLAGSDIQEAAGSRRRLLANLLPRARGESSVAVQTRNLEAQGISIPGAPTIVGPFSTYDFRLQVEQPVLDLSSFHRWKAGDKREQAARYSYQDVRDLIIRHVAGLYLSAQGAAARVEAAESRVSTARELEKLARDQREAGVATGVDVLRAGVVLLNEQQRLLETRNAAQQSLLALARTIGLDLGTSLELAERLEYKAVPLPEIHSAVATALGQRADYLSLQAQREAVLEEEKANRARWFPRLGVGGNYGAIGRAPGEVRGTGSVQATLSLELFSWDRQGEEVEIEARRRRVEDRLADLRLGIEQEIRNALLVLESAREEVNVALRGFQLAERELGLVRDRFQAGVTTNVEVTTAQEALARAQENRILALTRHADAKMALARALGATEEIYGQYLGIGRGGN